ncbi:MAG TPA: hypothetical protein VK981_04500 [Ramlibacter sp.]|nr:hypothetical protein [Ramlibacter sp.]
MKAVKSKRNEKSPPATKGKRPLETEANRTSGEGSASALASLRKLERNREKAKPQAECPDE